MAPYKKRLEGVQATDDLKKLLTLAKEKSAAASSDHESNADEDAGVRPRSTPHRGPGRVVAPEFPFGGNQQQRQLVVTTTFRFEWCEPWRSCSSKHGGRAAAAAAASEKNPQELLQQALHRTRLVFTPPPPSVDDDTVDETLLTPQQRKFRQRLQRLRLRREQDRYAALTQNLGGSVAVQDDGITVKSMTYAASIGLNMIVAPLSFGVFMYFFAGALLDKFWPAEAASAKANTATDIKRVIAGVTSGVLMLFIEMILFVIRTHEMDKALRRKQRKSSRLGQQQGPFGYYTAATSKTYTHEHGE